MPVKLRRPLPPRRRGRTPTPSGMTAAWAIVTYSQPESPSRATSPWWSTTPGATLAHSLNAHSPWQGCRVAVNGTNGIGGDARPSRPKGRRTCISARP